MHNAQDNIERCINSVFEQTYGSIQLIAIDDGSTDTTLEKCRNLLNVHPFVLITQKNQGVSSARNKGLKLATGDYCLFIDSDDFLEMTAVYGLVEQIEKSRSDMVIGSIVQFDKNNRKDIIIETKKFNKQSFIENFYPLIGHPLLHAVYGKLYSLSIINQNEIGFMDGLQMGEDFCFNLDYFAKCNEIFCESTIVYNYSSEVNELSNRYDNDAFMSRKIILKRLKSFFVDNKFQFDIVNFQYIKLAYSILIMLALNKDKKNNLIEIEKMLQDDDLIKAVRNTKPNNVYEFVLTSLLKSNNSNLLLCVGKLLRMIQKKRRMSIHE